MLLYSSRKYMYFFCVFHIFYSIFLLPFSRIISNEACFADLRWNKALKLNISTGKYFYWQKNRGNLQILVDVIGEIPI